jgi:hypothetical protein
MGPPVRRDVKEVEEVKEVKEQKGSSYAVLHSFQGAWSILHDFRAQTEICAA